MDYTIDGLTPADWVRRANEHRLHRETPWVCTTCFADENLHVPMYEDEPKHGNDPIATCETCWLATK